MNEQHRFGMALEYVADLNGARRFYEEVMGLKVQREHPHFVQFDHFAIANDVTVGELRERELYWLVDDAEAEFAAVSKKRVEITTPLQQLPFGKVFGVRGPAGVPCYMLEFAKDRPSEAV